MAEVIEGRYSLNAGEVSRYTLARVDLAKMRVSCEQQENFTPLVSGPAVLRPGTQFIARGLGDNLGFPFVFAKDRNSIAILHATNDGGLQILDGTTDTFITRPTVSAAVVNGNFTGDISSWTNNSETGGNITWVTGGFLGISGTGMNYGYASQQVTVFEPGVEHALRIFITRGDVVVKIGTTAGGGDYWNVELAEGEYSLAFNPIGNFHIRLGAHRRWLSLVDSVNVDIAGRLTLTHPWSAPGVKDLIRYDRSEDVLFVACKGFQQRRIERRNKDGMRAWGLAYYRVDDGPFRTPNLGSTLLAMNVTVGSGTLSATRDFFHAGHVGALIKLTHGTQTQTLIVAGIDQFTDPIRVTGVGATRTFDIIVSGRVDSTLTLQRSFQEVGSWEDVAVYTANTTTTLNDTFDNQIYWYRIGAKTGNYGTDTPTVTLKHSGTQFGIVRIRELFNSTSANADVLKQLGGLQATPDWAEGEWSDYRGWPAAVTVDDGNGRLFWQSDPRAQGSVSDAFHSFDSTVEGDSGPINRTTVKSEPTWMVSAHRLVVGSWLAEISIRSSDFGEPLTPTAFSSRAPSSNGSAQLPAIELDGAVLFVSRDARRVFMLEYDGAKTEMAPKELTRLKQEMCAAGIVSLAAQRQPDTRFHFVLADGTIAVLTYEPNETVAAWVPYTFGAGEVEWVAVLPGAPEDRVYVYVKRGLSRCIEKFAMREECTGGTLNKNIDSHVVYSGPLTNTLFAPAHLQGLPLIVWGDGAPIATQASFLVDSGAGFILPVFATNIVYGLAYSGRIKPSKLASATERGTSLSAPKKVGPVGLVMADVGWKGVKLGHDFDHLTELPSTYRKRPLDVDEVLIEYDDAPSGFNGGWGADPRICILAQAPYPCTVMGIVYGERVNEGEDLPAPRQRG